MSEISVEYGLEGPERVAASLVIILDIEQDWRRESLEKPVRFRKIYFYYSLKKEYKVWKDKNKDIFYVAQRALGTFSPSFVLHIEEHSSISTQQLSLRSSFPRPIGNQGQAKRLRKLLSD